jgi:DNA topoisomerase-1
MRDEPQAGQHSIRRSPGARRGAQGSYHGRARRPRRRAAAVAPPDPALDPQNAAKAAGLRYTSDSQPGIRRLGSARRFRYAGPDGRPVRDAETLARIKSLVIPPAWTSVWICSVPHGHLQATGVDARGRKQYRYHAKWRKVRDETKYDRMTVFGYSLPQIRERIERDLTLPGLSRPKVLATVVQLMERTLIRVGNGEYARSNDSYGITTLRDAHVRLNGFAMKFRFRGKSGVAHEIDVRDRRLASIVRRCRDLPGYELFQYLDDEGEVRDVESNDVNEYLKEITGEAFTSKDFRTWAGTVLAAEALRLCPPCRTKKQLQRTIVSAIDQVASRLGNTRAVCRKCYVHPAVLAAFERGVLARAFARRAGRGARPPAGLGEGEVAVLRLLEGATAR